MSLMNVLRLVPLEKLYQRNKGVYKGIDKDGDKEEIRFEVGLPSGRISVPKIETDSPVPTLKTDPIR